MHSISVQRKTADGYDTQTDENNETSAGKYRTEISSKLSAYLQYHSLL